MKKWHQMKRKRIASLCVIALFAGSLLVPSADLVQGKTKKPALNKKKLSLREKQSSKIKVKRAKGYKITWKIKNKKIARIKKSGKTAVKVTAKKKGKTTLTAKLRKGKKRCTLTCKITVTTGKTPVPVPSESPASLSVNDSTHDPGNVTPSQAPPAGGNGSAEQNPAGTPSFTPVSVVTQTPPPAFTAQPGQSASAAPSVTPAPTAAPTPVISKNILEGSTVKSTDSNITASVQDGKATAEFSNASQYEEAEFSLPESFALGNVTSIQFNLTVSGTPDSVCIKFYDKSGTELSKLTRYNKGSGSYTTSVPDELKSKTIAGYAIMTNSDIKDTTQTATAILESLTYESSGSVSPAPATPAPIYSGTTIALSDETYLTSACVSGEPTYNSDGSVTFTVTKQSGGGGMGFSLNTSGTAMDLSDYSKAIFRISADSVDAPVILNYFTSSDFWKGWYGMMTTMTTKQPKEVICNIPHGSDICGFGVKYNTYGYDSSALPKELTLTIHSITLVKDERDITDATTNYSSLSELAASYGFKMGTVMNSSNIYDPKYSELMKYHFNSITAGNEMKAYSMLDQSASKAAYVDENSMPVINFDNADKIMNFAYDNGLKVRGHTLVWDANMNDWFCRVGYDTSKDYASEEVIKTRLQNYIEQVVTHFETNYPGVIYCWDVVNEAVGDSETQYEKGDSRHVRTMRDGTENVFYKTIGSDYVELSFQYTHEVIEGLRRSNPDLDIKLYYNDYNTFYSDKRDAICALVESINSYLPDGNGGYVKLCDGVGMQSYIGGFGHQEGCMEESDIIMVEEAIRKFASLGVEVQATELAVRNYQDDAETLAKHADFYKKLFQTYIDINSGDSKPLTAVSIWGAVDNPDMDPTEYGYRMNGPYCGLFDSNLAVKDSFINIHDLMKNGN